jgi:L-ribulose-5-phosphate 3-epimerase
MTNPTRRQFLLTTAAASACVLCAGRASAAPKFKTKLKTALIRGLPDEKIITELKTAGYDGMECSVWDTTPEKAAAARQLAEKAGLRIHSVLRGWTQFNDEKKFDEGLKSVETALLASQAYGADALLLVPCRIGGGSMKLPKPREFQFEFDAKTGRIKKAVAGDNEPYADYITAHNLAIDTTRKAFEKLIPIAEKTGVVIAHENVWNNLWVKPDIFANFVGSFQSPWLRIYFDIGNHVKYAPPEEWIRTLGKLIAKCHVKDFKLNDTPGGDGKFINIRDGSVNWPTVRGALEAIGYSGWMTIEGGNLTPAEHHQRLAQIIAGE